MYMLKYLSGAENKSMWRRKYVHVAQKISLCGAENMSMWRKKYIYVAQ